jgi:hypothetical protein
MSAPAAPGLGRWRCPVCGAKTTLPARCYQDRAPLCLNAACAEFCRAHLERVPSSA